MSKKLVIVGAALEGTHEVVRVGNSRGELKVDITRSDRIRALFEKLGRVDAIVAGTTCEDARR